MMTGRRVTATLVAVAAAFLISAAQQSPARAGTGCDLSQPTVCAEPGKVVQLVPTRDDTCALTDRGTVYCWAESDETRQPVTNFSLLLITVGSLLVAGGASLVLISRP